MREIKVIIRWGRKQYGMLVLLTGKLSGQQHALTLKHPKLGTDSHNEIVLGNNKKYCSGR